MSAARTSICLSVVALVLSGCGISTDDHARQVDARVDEGFVPIVDPEPTQTGAAETTVPIWLVGESRLHTSTRSIDVDADTASTGELLSATLRELFEGPRARDAAAGLRSALPPETELIGVSIAGSLATVEVTSAITRVGGADEVRAIAQIVLTATEVPGVQRVRFVVDDEPIQVPAGTGALTSRAVTAADYQELIRG